MIHSSKSWYSNDEAVVEKFNISVGRIQLHKIFIVYQLSIVADHTTKLFNQVSRI